MIIRNTLPNEAKDCFRWSSTLPRLHQKQSRAFKRLVDNTNSGPGTGHYHMEDGSEGWLRFYCDYRLRLPGVYIDGVDLVFRHPDCFVRCWVSTDKIEIGG